MKDLKNVAMAVRRHGKVVLKGLMRAMYGTATAALFALAAYGFAMITTESGWVAVLEFLASTAVAVLGAAAVYAQGVDTKKGAKR